METSVLARLEHDNWIDYLAASISLGAEGLVGRDRGIVTLLGHVPMRFFNQILVEDEDAPAAAIEAAVAVGRARGDPFAVSLREGADERFTPLMAELGLVAFDRATTRAMTLYPVGSRGHTREPVPDFEIRQVTDEAGLSEHRQMVTEGFAAHESIAREMMGAGLLDRPEASIYVGYLNGRPVTSGFGWRTGRTIGVYNIATLPEARRRGFGEAMSARVVTDGAAGGCDVAVLQASTMGQPIYERLGFRRTLRYIGFVEPAPLR